jgi:hypothetical protein
VIHVVIPVSPPAPVGQGQGAAESARSDRQQADGYHHTDRTDGPVLRSSPRRRVSPSDLCTQEQPIEPRDTGLPWPGCRCSTPQ